MSTTDTPLVVWSAADLVAVGHLADQWHDEHKNDTTLDDLDEPRPMNQRDKVGSAYMTAWQAGQRALAHSLGLEYRQVVGPSD